MTTEKGKTPIQHDLPSYLLALLIGGISGISACLYAFAGPTAGFVTTSIRKPPPNKTLEHGLLVGLVAAISQGFAIFTAMSGFFTFDLTNWGASDVALFAGFAIWTIVTCTATSMIVGRRRPTPEEIAKSKEEAKVRREAAAKAAPAANVIEAAEGFLAFSCPSCGASNKVNVSAFSGSGSYEQSSPRVLDSGRTTRVPTRALNIIIELAVSFIVALAVAACSGSLLLFVIAWLITMATGRLWLPPLVKSFGQLTPIWLVECPACQAKSEVIKYADTAKPTFEILARADEGKEAE